jgi:hypothetical protein
MRARKLQTKRLQEGGSTAAGNKLRTANCTGPCLGGRSGRNGKLEWKRCENAVVAFRLSEIAVAEIGPKCCK